MSLTFKMSFFQHRKRLSVVDHYTTFASKLTIKCDNKPWPLPSGPSPCKTRYEVCCRVAQHSHFCPEGIISSMDSLTKGMHEIVVLQLRKQNRNASRDKCSAYKSGKQVSLQYVQFLGWIHIDLWYGLKMLVKYLDLLHASLARNVFVYSSQLE